MSYDDRSITGYEKALLETQAGELIRNNVAFKEACLRLKGDLIEEWINTGSDETDKRERIYMFFTSLGEISDQLNNLYEDGLSRKQGTQE